MANKKNCSTGNVPPNALAKRTAASTRRRKRRGETQGSADASWSLGRKEKLERRVQELGNAPPEAVAKWAAPSKLSSCCSGEQR